MSLLLDAFKNVEEDHLKANENQQSDTQNNDVNRHDSSAARFTGTLSLEAIDKPGENQQTPSLQESHLTSDNNNFECLDDSEEATVMSAPIDNGHIELGDTISSGDLGIDDSDINKCFAFTQDLLIEDSIDILAKIELFRSLDRSDLKVLDEGLTEKVFPEGQTLITVGNPGDSMYILTEGLLGVYIPSESGTGEVRVGELKTGQFFGEMSLLTGEPRSATVIAESYCRVYEIGKTSMSKLLARRQEIAESLSNVVAERSLRNSKTLANATEAQTQTETANTAKTLLAKIRSFLKPDEAAIPTTPTPAVASNQPFSWITEGNSASLLDAQEHPDIATNIPPTSGADHSKDFNLTPTSHSTNQKNHHPGTSAWEPTPADTNAIAQTLTQPQHRDNSASHHIAWLAFGCVIFVVVTFSIIGFYQNEWLTKQLAKSSLWLKNQSITTLSTDKIPITSAPTATHIMPVETSAKSSIKTATPVATTREIPSVTQQSEQNHENLTTAEIEQSALIPTIDNRPQPTATATATATMPATTQLMPPEVTDTSIPEPPSVPLYVNQVQKQKKIKNTNALLHKAYKLFLAQNNDAAKSLYQRVLKENANNRDALLGLAAIAMKRGQNDTAYHIYLKLLIKDPRDSVVMAGLIGLKGLVDPYTNESRIKRLLQLEPSAPHLHFALGTLYGAQARWAEAQQAFFNAFKGNSQNIDHIFNLAVSLDHLGKPKAALDYYRMAFDRSKHQSASFVRSDVHDRIMVLDSLVGKEGT